MSEHEAEASGAREQLLVPRGRSLPLNSKRLTGAYLRQVATALGLPTEGSADQLRQVIEGQLETDGHEAANIQVFLSEDAFVETRLSLVGESGVILESQPVKRAAQEKDRVDDEWTQELEEAHQRSDELDEQLEVERQRTATLQEQMQQMELDRAEVSKLKEELRAEKERGKQLWKMSCEQVKLHDQSLSEKDAEIARLKEQLAMGHSPLSPVRDDHSSRSSVRSEPDLHVDLPRPSSPARVIRRGKAPPVDSFTGENPEVILDDWLPSLKRASQWNGWTPDELLLQFAGHLRGRALQEWSLLDEDDKKTYDQAVTSLRNRLEPGGRALAAQDFRHTAQKEAESVAEFIRRLERTFKLAYGREAMSSETRNALLHGQLQEGLRHEIMSVSAVSGAQKYQELCLAAKNEERRLAELQKRKQYRTPQATNTVHERPGPQRSPGASPRSCYNCGQPGHLARDCQQRKSESAGRQQPRSSQQQSQQSSSRPLRPPQARQVTADVTPGNTELLNLLYSSSDEEADIRMVRVQDKGSQPHCAPIQIQGVPAYGIIDSGADITIIGGNLFRKVAAAARLKKRDLQKPNKNPRTYDQKPFQLDGRMDLDISFAGQTMLTPVYIKMDAHDQLLLSEGVCRQLKIVAYHADVEKWRGRRKQASERQPAEAVSADDAQVPTVRVQTIQVPPLQSALVRVRVEGAEVQNKPVLMERSRRKRSRSLSSSSEHSYTSSAESSKSPSPAKRKSRKRKQKHRSRSRSKDSESGDEMKKRKRLSSSKTERKRRKNRTRHKKKKVSSSSDEKSSESELSSSEDDRERRTKSKKRKKKKKRQDEKLAKKRKQKKPKKLSESLQSPSVPVRSDVSSATANTNSKMPKEKVAAAKVKKTAAAVQQQQQRRPMTKEEYEKQQSIVRRVFDPDTGRHRLVKGDGEIVEEIVSKERQKTINKQATMGDGLSFMTGLNRFS